MIIGLNIKRVRKGKGLTLRGLAKQLKVSASLLSQVETGKASPSLVTLKNIADTLGTTVGNLVGEEQNPTDNPIVREKDRKSIRRISSGMNMYLLTQPDSNKQMEPLLFKMDPKSNSGKSMYRHFGQEFILVLRGKMEIVLNGKKYRLNKGDSIYFNSSVPHAFKNLYSGTTEALWVDTPPTF